MPSVGHDMPMDVLPFGPIFGLVFALVIIVRFWRIFAKAGYSRWLSLLMVVPIVNLIALYFLDFSPWPSLQKRD